MAALAAIPAWAMVATSVAATAASAAISAEQSKQQQRAQEMAADANAKRAMIAAGQAEASGQRKANEARRKADILASRALAVAAASGAGTAGIDSMLAGFAEAGEEEAGYQKYSSTEASKGMIDAANIGKVFQENRSNAMRAERSATAIESVGQAASMYSKYKGSGAPSTGSTPSADIGAAQGNYPYAED